MEILEYKYALSNATDGEFEVEELARMQSQEYYTNADSGMLNKKQG
ncbi:hypothetical protein [Chitinophaga sp. LS1]|jgi:hypothetical protein|nr:hypothetical protein [Chitinophaga sp. LS1]WPV66718.1 hypothetical protein QQL36_33525 [Chitinophaga sp. LS1]